ncbi:hypothetical protein [Niallia sp. 01092]|uniref:hypothetical protein n=1 Tax=unclassified Niallia TaxID=2837522 RepID=UPI003FD47B00
MSLFQKLFKTNKKNDCYNIIVEEVDKKEDESCSQKVEKLKEKEDDDERSN